MMTDPEVFAVRCLKCDGVLYRTVAAPTDGHRQLVGQPQLTTEGDEQIATCPYCSARHSMVRGIDPGGLGVWLIDSLKE